MSVVDDFDSTDPDYFENLVRSIDRHSAWNVQNGTDIADIGEEAGQGPTEVRYDHEYSDALLNLSVPSRDFEFAAKGEVALALDPVLYMDSGSSTLVNELSEAHGRISGEVADSNYLKQMHEPMDVVELRVPFDYGRDQLEDSLEGASEAAGMAQEMHNNMIEVIQDFP